MRTAVASTPTVGRSNGLTPFSFHFWDARIDTAYFEGGRINASSMSQLAQPKSPPAIDLLVCVLLDDTRKPFESHVLSSCVLCHTTRHSWLVAICPLPFACICVCVCVSITGVGQSRHTGGILEHLNPRGTQCTDGLCK